MPRIALIANPDSGPADDLDVADLLADGGAELVRFGIGEADEAADAGAERIVVAGGDGSIAPAASAAAKAGVELAVVATGTANDFADRMGLPLDVRAAVELALDGREARDVDLAHVGGRAFLNVASLGLAPAAADAARELKPKLGALAYSVGALSAAGSEQPQWCSVRCSDQVLYEGDAWQVMVACTGAFGGGSRIEADADDGRLDAVVIEGGPRTALAKRAIGLRTGRLERQEGVHSARCAEIRIELSEPADLNIDGELVSSAELGGEQLRLTVEHHALKLVVG